MGAYETLLPEQCKHKGRPYRINGLLTMVLCICCVTRIRRKATISLRLVKKGSR